MIMHKCLRLLTLIGLVVALGVPSRALAFTFEEDHVQDQIVVELIPGMSIDDVNADHGTTTIASIQFLHLYLLDVSALDGAAIDALVADWRIVEAEGNAEARAPDVVGGDTQTFFFYVPPSEFEEHYAWNLLGLGLAHGISTGDGVIVAVLDTGVDALHSLLLGKVLPDGYDFVDGDADVADVGNGLDDDGDGDIDELTGHGTAISGLVAKVAPDASLLPVRILDSDGAGDTFRTAQGVYYAIEQGADVINLSVGTTSNNHILRDAVEAAREAGILVVASAGNDDRQNPVQMPAGDLNVVGVAATDATDVKSEFSNFGGHIGLSAPGTDVVSIMPGNAYASCSGTSLAAGFVSATGALVKALDPSATPAQIETTIEAAAVDIDGLNPEYAGLLGSGRLSAALAVGVAPIPADLDGNWVVDVNDSLLLLGQWGACPDPPEPCTGDLDGDGTVGVSDFLILLASWG
jgi:hypothetical protein